MVPVLDACARARAVRGRVADLYLVDLVQAWGHGGHGHESLSVRRFGSAFGLCCLGSQSRRPPGGRRLVVCCRVVGVVLVTSPVRLDIPLDVWCRVVGERYRLVPTHLDI